MGTVARHLPSCLSLSDLTAMATHTATATAMAMATRTAASDYTAAMPGFTKQGMDMATHTPACTAATHLVLDTDTRTADTRTAEVMDMVIHTISASKSSQEVVLDGIFHADEIASI